MYDKGHEKQSFSVLAEDAIHFISYVAKEAKIHFDLSEESELENTFDSFEKRLREKSKFNSELMQLLYKIKKSRKLLKKLHETWEIGEAREDVIRAIRGEASYEELEAILEKTNKIGTYYNYQEIRGVLLRKKKGEFGDEYFKSWLILLANSLSCEKYAFLSNHFDACSFYDNYNDKTLSEMLATLKDFNYKLTHADFMRRHKREKLKVIYLRFLHFNVSTDSRIFKAYFVDYKKKRFDVRIIDDALFDYRDDLMYCDIWSNHFDEEGDYIDQHGEYDFEPAELSEETELMELFYDESWTYDHELNF